MEGMLMSYTPPTITAIRSQIVTDIEGAIGQTVPILPKAFIRVLAVALSGPLALFYSLVAWLYRQISPVTCERAMLLYWGQRYNILPKEASAAILGITITGADGATCPAGTLWYSADNGLVYQQLADATISGTTQTAQVECMTEGEDGNLTAGDALTLPSPVTGITDAEVDSVVEAGVDAEETEDYRLRILTRMRYQSIIGTAGGYVSQALEYEGIVKAFADESAGDVIVYPLQDTTGPSRVPSAGTITAVEDYLQSTQRRPLCVNVYAQAATERTVDITITGLSPADAGTKAAIEAAIDEYLYAAYPRQYSDELAPTDFVSVGSIWAIVVAAGATATAISINISGIGGGPYQLPIGEIVKKGTLSWA
jgi:uncharacterized phage protein gp47/JayE